MDEFKEKKLIEDSLARIYEDLKVKKVVITADSFDDGEGITPELLSKLLNEPSSFKINNDGELTVTIDDEVVILDPKRQSASDISDQETKIVSNLPEIPWDIYCQGLKRKQQETVAAYKVIVVNSALGEIYKARIDDIQANYDYATLRSTKTDGETYSSLLKIVEQDAGSVTKFLLSCCSIKISSKKQRGEKTYIGTLPEADVTWLIRVSETIGDIEAKTSKLLERESSRLERLKLIEKKDSQVRVLLENEVYGDARRDVIFKISRLTSDDLPARRKILIKEATRVDLGVLLANKTIVDEDIYSKLLKKISRRAIRQAVRNMQKEKYELLMNPFKDSSNLLPKS